MTDDEKGVRNLDTSGGQQQMTVDEFRRQVRAFGVKAFANLLGVNRGTVSRWLHGGLAIPTYATAILDLQVRVITLCRQLGAAGITPAVPAVRR